jgi:hypothetical protein
MTGSGARPVREKFHVPVGTVVQTFKVRSQTLMMAAAQ